MFVYFTERHTTVIAFKTKNVSMHAFVLHNVALIDAARSCVCYMTAFINVLEYFALLYTSPAVQCLFCCYTVSILLYSIYIHF